jgi:hypothetical protein
MMAIIIITKNINNKNPSALEGVMRLQLRICV